jgi:hypothetical protein
MKKKKLEAKLTKTKKKLAQTRDELDAMLALIDQSGLPKAAEKPFVGKEPKSNSKAPAKKPAAKPATSAARNLAAKKPVAKPSK